MTTLGGLLQIGRSSLVTHQAAIGIVSGNTANADTPGFARREVSMQSLPGAGVGIAAVMRRSASFVEQRVLMSSARFGAHNAKAEGTSAIENTFVEGSSSIGARIDAMFASMRTLSTNPGDLQLRADVIARGQAVTASFSSAAAAIEREQASADAAIRVEVQRVNQLTAAIARANSSVMAEAPNSPAAAEALDQRERLVHELAGLLEIKTLAADDGSLTVLLQGGAALVQSATSASLRTTPDAALGGRSRVDLVDSSGAALDVTDTLRGGTIGGRLELRDEILADAGASLDNLAYDFATAFNAVHAAGFGSDGGTGRNFFATPAAVTGAADSLALETGLADNPAWLATAGSAATSIGGNENLLGLIALADAPIALGGTATAGQAVASIVADIGRAARSESDAAADASMQLEQNKALYQSETGVSIDEELIDLTRFERAYQAGARIIETVDRMFEAVLAI